MGRFGKGDAVYGARAAAGTKCVDKRLLATQRPMAFFKSAERKTPEPRLPYLTLIGHLFSYEYYKAYGDAKWHNSDAICALTRVPLFHRVAPQRR